MEEEWYDVKWILNVKETAYNFIPDEEDYWDYAVYPYENRYDE